MQWLWVDANATDEGKQYVRDNSAAFYAQIDTLIKGNEDRVSPVDSLVDPKFTKGRLFSPEHVLERFLEQWETIKGTSTAFRVRIESLKTDTKEFARSDLKQPRKVGPKSKSYPGSKIGTKASANSDTKPDAKRPETMATEPAPGDRGIEGAAKAHDLTKLARKSEPGSLALDAHGAGGSGAQVDAQMDAHMDVVGGGSGTEPNGTGPRPGPATKVTMKKRKPTKTLATSDVDEMFKNVVVDSDKAVEGLARIIARLEAEITATRAKIDDRNRFRSSVHVDDIEDTEDTDEDGIDCNVLEELENAVCA